MPLTSPDLQFRLVEATLDRSWEGSAIQLEEL
jgi:hypothetical protein